MSSNVEKSKRVLPIAEAAVLSLKEQLVSIEFIDDGSTSEVFLVKSDSSDYVLKTAKPHPGKTTSYLSDFAIRKALIEQGLPVAKPIATNNSMSTGINNVERLKRSTIRR